MIKIDEDYIKSLPLVTNRINVALKRDDFFSEYAIVSYYSRNKEHNLAYEQLAETPCISVTGIRARWNNKTSVKFFILVRRCEVQKVLESLRTYDDVSSSIDNLDMYDKKIEQRIIASLAINALGKRKDASRMYNDGALLICDENNFGAKKSRKELVCLRIEVNEYLNLTAKTNSFSNPRSEKDLLKHRNCVFQVSKDMGGYLWGGQNIKPVVIKNIGFKGIKLEDLYIKKKRFSDNKNIVPYWPYNKDGYIHGRLFAITQVLESVNELFSPLIEITFAESQVLHYDACKTGDDMLGFIRKGLAGTSLYIDDPFKTDGSKQLTESLVKEFKEIVSDSLSIHKKQQSEDMVVKLCEPNEDKPNVHYEQSLYRMGRADTVLQHCIYDEEEKDYSINKAKARRLLIELLVKHDLVCKKMQEELASLVDGWSFTRYKIKDMAVHGATMTIERNGSFTIVEHGLSNNPFGEDFETFCRDQFHMEEADLIKCSRDYMAMRKDGNTYLIIDTDEIPILDAKLIDEGYGKIVNEGEPLSMFKRKKVSHDYLRGYIGFHLWRSEGLQGEPNGSYSYISGTNSENIQILSSSKMDKMPRARRIFTLHADNPDIIDSQIMGISQMLKFGFGRWNEIMTYPFPFKYLYEYLDNTSEVIKSKHWSEF